jgi:phosphoglycolate phosphatase
VEFNPAQIRALLFDLDGTLIDSSADIAASANHLRLELGLEALDPQLIATYIGDGLEALVRRVLGKEEVAAEAQLFKAYYHEHCVDSTRFYPAVEETIRALHSRAYAMAVVTNKPERISVRILEQLGVGSLFGCVIGGNSTAKKKPDPEPLQLACQKLGVDLRTSCMIGDSRVDVEAGHNAGVPALALLGGIGDEALLKASAPERILSSFSELTQIFKGPR